MGELYKPEEIAGVYQALFNRPPTGEEVARFIDTPLEEIVADLLEESAQKAELEASFYNQFPEYAELDKCDADFKVGEALEQIFIRTFGTEPTPEQLQQQTIEAQQLGGGIEGVATVVSHWIEHLFSLAVGGTAPTFPGEEESAYRFKNKAIVGMNVAKAFPTGSPEELAQFTANVDQTTESVEEALNSLGVVPTIPFGDNFYLTNLYYINHPDQKPLPSTTTTTTTTPPPPDEDLEGEDGTSTGGESEGDGTGTDQCTPVLVTETLPTGGVISYYVCPSAGDIAPTPPESHQITTAELLHWLDGG